MSYQRKEMTFSAFKNTRREKDTHPHLTGEALINGEYYWVNVWKNKDKNSETYISGSLQKKDLSEAKPKDEPPRDELEDEIPF